MAVAENRANVFGTRLPGVLPPRRDHPWLTFFRRFATSETFQRAQVRLIGHLAALAPRHNPQINLLLEYVYPRYSHKQPVTDAKALPRSAADDTPPHGIEYKKISI
jgi:hypothetical protein